MAAGSVLIWFAKSAFGELAKFLFRPVAKRGRIILVVQIRQIADYFPSVIPIANGVCNRRNSGFQ